MQPTYIFFLNPLCRLVSVSIFNPPKSLYYGKSFRLFTTANLEVTDLQSINSIPIQEQFNLSLTDYLVVLIKEL